MPSLLTLLTTFLPDTVLCLAGIVLAVLLFRRSPVAAGLAIAGCVFWLAQGVVAWMTFSSTSDLVPIVLDVIFAVGMGLIIAAAIVGIRRRPATEAKP